MSNWSLAQCWNVALENVPQREFVERDYAWASELGGSLYDRYWKMHGRQPTTPPGARAKRKFEAGNLLEYIILQVLNRARVLQSTQEHFEYTIDELPKVTGRCDFKAGGQIQDADFSDLPETIKGISEATIASLREKFPDGLDEVNIEVKSCAGVIFDRYIKAPAPQHALQAFIQARATNRPTLLVYVSRDDLRIVEWKILPRSQKYKELLHQDLELLQEFLQIPEEDMPYHLEPLLVWDGKKFSSNWKIEYSNYLTDYGYDRPDEYSKPAKSFALRLSNVAKKIREDKPLTKINYKTLEEGIDFYPDAKDIFIELGVEEDLLKKEKV